MARSRPKLEIPDPYSRVPYFVSNKPGLQFVSTGCTVLDCALGGGFVLGRVANIVGDKSTAKTGLACEVVTNFLRAYPDGIAKYRESEAAFDTGYAEAMGMPIKRVDFGDERLPTIEAWARDLDAFCSARADDKKPGIYVLDSLDALSDEAELGRDFGEASYGTGKAKAGSEMFRKLIKSVETTKVLVVIVSQTRDNIGVLFGQKYKRSGGKWLDFYATHVLYLAHVKTLTKRIKKIDRAYGILVKAKVTKNKVAFPFREAEFEFTFGYGIDDLRASIAWLDEVGALPDAIDCDKKVYWKQVETMTDPEFRKEQGRVANVVKKCWREIETTFLPKRRKYA